MKAETAKRLHESVNITFWAERIGMDTGSAVLNLGCRALRPTPFSFHELQKKTVYNTRRVLAVNGEAVVAAGDQGTVDKFMFRYPGDMSLDDFEARVSEEVGIVTRSLASVALATEVGIKPARIFRVPGLKVDAVAQTQARLDLITHAPLKLSDMTDSPHTKATDKTALDIEALLGQIYAMASEYEMYPDIAQSSGNLRRHVHEGSVTLIDVMPVYANGKRLIDDGANILPSSLKGIEEFGRFVGNYGA